MDVTSVVSRRWVLKTFLLAGGGLAVGCSRIMTAEESPPQTSPVEFTAMVRIYPDNRTVVVPPAAEMGQDVFTGLAKIIADEMDLDWEPLEIEIAPHSPDFYDATGSQSTGSSRSTRSWYLPLRQLGAASRQVLMQAAAHRWQLAVTNCYTESGYVIDSNGGRRLSYGDLAIEASSLTLPEQVPLKTDQDLKLIGKPTRRKDSKAKTTGQAVFGADIRLPRQVYAAIRMAPGNAGQVKSFDESRLAEMPGIIGAFTLENALAIVADGWWQAHSALKILEVEFTANPDVKLDDSFIEQELELCLRDDRGVEATLEGDPDGMLASGNAFEAHYSVPYLAHACMEPMTATVSVEKDRILAIAPTQSPQRCAVRIAEHTGRPIEAIEMRNTFLGGGFGRKGLDFAALLQATDLSKQLKRPVQVIWDRETDIRHDQYRPAAKYWFRASLTGSGKIDAVDLRVATQSLRRSLLPQFYKPGQHELPSDLFVYETAARRHVWAEAELPITVGFWRAVGHSNHPFASECFVDELAHKAGQDPYAFRRAHLTSRPRTLAALDAAAKAAKWGRVLPKGRGLGIAVQEGWDSVCAQVAEVSVTDGRPKVHKFWAAVDCGKIISPDSVEAQIEGGIVYALTAALKGRISFQAGSAVESNFHNYRMLTMAEMPEIEVILLDSKLPPGGVGELGVPACAPCVVNALYAATGYRARSLPLSEHLPP